MNERQKIQRPWGSLVAGLLFTAGVFCGPTANLNAADSFRFTNITDKSLALFEGTRPVLVYNHGVIQQPAGVPADRARGTYVHPIYGLDGEILTDDFPKDHYAHRGLFWGWPHIRIGTGHYDLWDLRGIEQRFERWLARDAGAPGATLGIQNGWYVGDRKIVQEEVWLRATPSAKNERVLDVELKWTPIGEPLTLQGAPEKSYGGFTLRFAPRTNTVITTQLGQGEKDLLVTRLPWADFSAHFGGRAEVSGAAILVAPDHPDFPPEWMTRHYGLLCVGWPGVQPKTLPPGETARRRYRVWIHRGAGTVESVSQAWRAYEQSLRAAR
jgi:methane monooxygenase PmoA-like